MTDERETALDALRAADEALVAAIAAVNAARRSLALVLRTPAEPERPTDCVAGSDDPNEHVDPRAVPPTGQVVCYACGETLSEVQEPSHA